MREQTGSESHYAEIHDVNHITCRCCTPKQPDYSKGSHKISSTGDPLALQWGNEFIRQAGDAPSIEQKTP